MSKIEKVLQEFSRDITDHYTIVVQDEKGRRRFTFKDHRVRALETELKKHYGDKVVRKIVGKIKRAETRGTLKNFAVDDSVDFIIDGESIKALFKEDINEVSAEIAKSSKGQLGYVPRKIFDAQNNQISWENMKPAWKGVMQEVISALVKNPKVAAKFAPNTGEVDLHLGKGKNLVFLTSDDGSKYKYNVVTKRLEAA